MFLGAVRLQISEILIERKGDESAIGIREAISEGKSYHLSVTSYFVLLDSDATHLTLGVHYSHMKTNFGQLTSTGSSSPMQ